MMKQIYALLLCCVLLLGLAGCGADTPQASSELPPAHSVTPQNSSSVPGAEEAPPVKARSADAVVSHHSVSAIQKRGTLVVAMVENNPPFTFFNDDFTRQGLDNTVANTIAEDLQVALEVFSGTPDEVVDAVRTGRADIAMGGFEAGSALLRNTLETNLYAGGKQVLICCIEDVKLYATLDSFRTKSVVCLQRYPEQAEILKELMPTCFAKQVSSVEAGVKKLRSGTCAAMMLDEFQATAYIQDSADLGLATPPLTTETMVQPKAMALMQGNEDLLKFLNESILKKYTVSGGLGRLMISATTKASNLDLLDDK